MATHLLNTIAGNSSTGGTGGSGNSITGSTLTDHLQEPNDDGGTTAIGLTELQTGLGDGSGQAETDSDIVFYLSGTSSARIKIRSNGSSSGTGPNALSLDSAYSTAPASEGGQTVAVTTTYSDKFVFNATSTITGIRVKGTTLSPTNGGVGIGSGGAPLSPTVPLRTLNSSALPTTASQAFDTGWITSGLSTGLLFRVNQGHVSASTACEEEIYYDFNAEIEFWVRASGKADTLIKTFRARYEANQSCTDACG